MKAQKIKEPTRFSVPTILGSRTIYETKTIYVPDYEKTNIKIVKELTKLIENNAKDIGEIININIEPRKTSYEYLIRLTGAFNEYSTKVAVGEDFGLFGEEE